MSKLHLVAWLFLCPLAVYSSPQSDYQMWADQACRRIVSIYSRCGEPIVFENNTLYLDSNRLRILCSDGQRLSFYDRLRQMDIASVFMFPYKTGLTESPESRKNYDPGRLRPEELFKKIYGADQKSVQKNLVQIQVLGNKVWFQKKLGAAKALKQISNELEKINDPEVQKYLSVFTTQKDRPSTFNWRVVAGTTRLSPHSFGTAVDLIVPFVKAQYWLWDEKETNPEKAKLGEGAYENDHYIPSKTPYFPQKIVDVFEKNGFIWGGKWNHYDTMHFEYRPEFIDGYQPQCE